MRWHARTHARACATCPPQREQLKALRASLPFSSVEAVDAKLEDLEHQLTTTSLPLPEERALVKQIETLRRQRQQVAELSGAGSAGGANVGEILDGLSAQLTGVFAQLDEVRERLNAQWEIRRAVEGRRNEARGNLPQLYKQRDGLRDQLRADFALRKSTKEESFKARQAARKAAEERRKAREAEYEARKAAQRAEEAAAKREEAAAAAARHPHEQELATADVLAAYMRAVVAQGAAEETASSAAAPAGAAAAGAASSVAAAGLKPMGKKQSSDVDELNALATSGKGKKARKARKAARAAPSSSSKDALVMDVAMLQQLAQVGLPVPRRAADIPDLLAQLEAKVAAWKAVPMPTAAQVEAQVAKMVGPAEGAQVSTPYGAGTLSSVRAADGIHVVKLAGFAGTGYLRAEDVQSEQ